MKKGARVASLDPRKRRHCTVAAAIVDMGTEIAAARKTDICVGTVACITGEGCLVVATDTAMSLDCDWFDSGRTSQLAVVPGDRVMVWTHPSNQRPVVMGRIGPYRAHADVAHLTLEATESLTLKCGEASVELRADGRAMVKGEDVLLRAKGTQRIRAGNVAIN